MFLWIFLYRRINLYFEEENILLQVNKGNLKFSVLCKFCTGSRAKQVKIYLPLPFTGEEFLKLEFYFSLNVKGWLKQELLVPNYCVEHIHNCTCICALLCICQSVEMKSNSALLECADVRWYKMNTQKLCSSTCTPLYVIFVFFHYSA